MEIYKITKLSGINWNPKYGIFAVKRDDTLYDLVDESYRYKYNKKTEKERFNENELEQLSDENTIFYREAVKLKPEESKKAIQRVQEVKDSEVESQFFPYEPTLMFLYTTMLHKYNEKQRFNKKWEKQEISKSDSNKLNKKKVCFEKQIENRREQMRAETKYVPPVWRVDTTRKLNALECNTENLKKENQKPEDNKTNQSTVESYSLDDIVSILIEQEEVVENVETQEQLIVRKTEEKDIAYLEYHKFYEKYKKLLEEIDSEKDKLSKAKEYEKSVSLKLEKAFANLSLEDMKELKDMFFSRENEKNHERK